MNSYGPGQFIKRDHRAEVPKSGCSKLWMATNGAGKARIRTRTSANFIVRCGDFDYEGPGADFGPGDHEKSRFLNFVFSDFSVFCSNEANVVNQQPAQNKRTAKYKVLYDLEKAKAWILGPPGGQHSAQLLINCLGMERQKTLNK